MTRHEFESLTKSEQDELVLNFGIYLLNYDQGYIMCDVYKLYHFFVKFCYDLRENSSPDISAFEGYEQFRLYQPNAFQMAEKNYSG